MNVESSRAAGDKQKELTLTTDTELLARFYGDGA